MSRNELAVFDLFVGREAEKKRFLADLHDLLVDPSPQGSDPYLFLIYGNGGMGKTCLARQLCHLAQQELPFVGQVRTLWIDWLDEAQKYPQFQFGRSSVEPEIIFQVVREVAGRKRWGKQFSVYNKALRLRTKLDKKVKEAVANAPSDESDETSLLTTLGIEMVARIVRMKIPMGDFIEEVIKIFAQMGMQIGIEQAKRLANKLQEIIQAHLDSEQIEYFLNPNQQLARALGRGLANVAGNKPLIVVMDSYEMIDRADIWLREVIREAGPQVVWLIVGRNDLVHSRRFGRDYFKGYEADFPQLVAFNLARLSADEIADYFAMAVPERTLSKSALHHIAEITHGIPLAVEESAEIWRAGVPIEALIGEESAESPSQIVQRLTDSYLRYVVAPQDREMVYALALARGDVEILRAMLTPENAEFQLDDSLHRLERDYASVHAHHARLHPAPAAFLLRHLQQDMQRSSPAVRHFVQQAIDLIQSRLELLQTEIPNLQRRYLDGDWIDAVLKMTEYQAWIDSRAGWRWLVPCLVEAWGYAPDLCTDLLQTAAFWHETWNDHDRRLFQSLRGVLPKCEDRERLQALRTLQKLAEYEWLAGDGEQDRLAIVHLRFGEFWLTQGELDQALTSFDSAEMLITDQQPLLKQMLADGLEGLGRALAEAPLDKKSAEPTQLFAKLTALMPQHQRGWYQLAVHQERSQQYYAALEAYRQALKRNPCHAPSFVGIGNCQTALQQYPEAIQAYQQALFLD